MSSGTHPTAAAGRGGASSPRTAPHRTARRLAAGLILGAAALVQACAGDPSTDDRYYEYLVSGEVCGADIRYVDRDGATRTVRRDTMPWSRLFVPESDAWDQLTLAATNRCDWGELKVRITEWPVRRRRQAACDTANCTAEAKLRPAQ